MSTEALVVFLNLIIASSAITTSEDRIIVHATEGDAHWIRAEDQWCTNAPQRDRLAAL